MSASSHQVNSFLEYNSEFQILICRECRYAIQKNAIDSHLLKHKIYRGDRQDLLSEIAQLELREPEHVLLPSTDSPPIAHLPVLDGYRCVVPDCEYLAVSEKRTRSHWSETHGPGETVPALIEFARRVHMQTFFRGNKVRYFEVSVPESDLETDDGDEPSLNEENVHPPELIIASPRERVSAQADNATLDPSLRDSSRALTSANGATPLHLNMEAMKYFFQFVTVTAATLPGSQSYWMDNISSNALNSSGVLSGLLALSACHSIALTHGSLDVRENAPHHHAFAAEFSTFILGRTDNAASDDTSKGFVHQTTCLLRCAQWAAGVPSDEGLPDLVTILNTIRECEVPQNPRSTSINLEHGNNREHLRSRASLFSVVLDHLEALPAQMSQVVDKPEDPQDFFAAHNAITHLIDCCVVSFASDDLRMAWRGVSLWLENIPSHFRDMIARAEPAALIITGYWVIILVKRAETNGCWFLKNVERRVLTHVRSQLSMANPAALTLVGRLLTTF